MKKAHPFTPKFQGQTRLKNISMIRKVQNVKKRGVLVTIYGTI